MPIATDTKTIAVNMLKGSVHLLMKDLEALPEEAFCRSFGPACRTVADLIYEVNMVNDHVGLTIRGEKLFEWPEGWIKAPPSFASKETVSGAFAQSMSRFISTVEGFTEEEMLAPIQTGDGKETNRFERCRFVALHNWYHSGQLNFIRPFWATLPCTGRLIMGAPTHALCLDWSIDLGDPGCVSWTFVFCYA